MRTRLLNLAVCLVLSSGLALAQSPAEKPNPGPEHKKLGYFVDEAKMGGKMVKSRYSIKELSPTSYTFKWETQGEDGAWQTVMEGKSTKVS